MCWRKAFVNLANLKEKKDSNWLCFSTSWEKATAYINTQVGIEPRTDVWVNIAIAGEHTAIRQPPHPQLFRWMSIYVHLQQGWLPTHIPALPHLVITCLPVAVYLWHCLSVALFRYKCKRFCFLMRLNNTPLLSHTCSQVAAAAAGVWRCKPVTATQAHGEKKPTLTPLDALM